MPRPFFGSGFFPAPPATPEAYAELIAFFGGDQAAADAYLSQLEGYAADGAEAQDLLDAAEAAGDVATAIAILGGGGGTIPEYDTIADVIVAIAATELVDGDVCLIRWTGDLYEPDGEAIVSVRNGRPSWETPIPWPQIGTTISTITASGGATVTQDGDGRPILTVPATSGAVAEVLLGLQIETPSLYRVKTHFTLAAPSSSGSGINGASLRRVGDANNYIQLFTQFSAGAWQAAGYYNAAPTATAAPVGWGLNPSNAAQFATGLGVSYDLQWLSQGLVQLPPTYFTADTESGGQSRTNLTTLAAAGSWLAASTELWEPYHRLRSTGTAGNEIITAIALATPA